MLCLRPPEPPPPLDVRPVTNEALTAKLPPPADGADEADEAAPLFLDLRFPHPPREVAAAAVESAVRHGLNTTLIRYAHVHVYIRVCVCYWAAVQVQVLRLATGTSAVRYWPIANAKGSIYAFTSRMAISRISPHCVSPRRVANFLLFGGSRRLANEGSSRISENLRALQQVCLR